VLVIALAVLGFDQLGGGASADAEAISEASSILVATTGSPSHKPARLPASAGEEISFASRLASVAQSTGEVAPDAIRDVFRPADIWLPKTTTISTVATVSSADKFVLEHKLSMVSVNRAGGGVAVVDGKLLNIGAKIDGYRLISINQQSAMFESTDGARVQLKLPADSATAAAR